MSKKQQAKKSNQKKPAVKPPPKKKAPPASQQKKSTKKTAPPSIPKALMESATYAVLPIDMIDLDPRNPRKSFDQKSIDELGESLAQNGQLQAIGVFPDADRWKVIYGQRRYLATKKIEKTHIDVKIYNVTPEQGLTMAITENLHRENIDPVEEALSVKELKALGYSIPEIARRLGKSPHWVASRLKLAEMSDEIQGMVSRGEISLRHVEALAKVDNAELRDQLARQSKHWSASDIESRVSSILRNIASAPFPKTLKVKTGGCEYGPCNNCVKRSDKQNDLFGPTDTARCTDSECWDILRESHRKSIISKLQKSGKEILSEADYPNARRKIYPWCRTDSEKSKAIANGNTAWHYVTENCETEVYYMSTATLNSEGKPTTKPNSERIIESPSTATDTEDDNEDEDANRSKKATQYIIDHVDALGWQKALIIILVNFAELACEEANEILKTEPDESVFTSKLTPIELIKGCLLIAGACNPNEQVLRAALTQIEGAPTWDELTKSFPQSEEIEE